MGEDKKQMAQGVMEKQVMWAVYGPDGKVNPRTIRKTKRDSIDYLSTGKSSIWTAYRHAGHKCEKVSVTIEPITKRQ